MSPPFVLRVTTWGIAGILALLNIVHLAYGLPRLRGRIALGEVSASLATPFLAAWLHAGLAGLAFSALLFVAAPDLAAGSLLARRIVITVSLALIAVGAGMFALARKHPGLLVIALFGIVLLVPLIVFRAHFHAR